MQFNLAMGIRLMCYASFILISPFILHGQSSSQHELDSIRRPIYKMADSINILGRGFSSTLQKTADPIAKKDLEYKLLVISNTWDSLQKERCKLDIEFAKRNLSSPFSLEVLGFSLIRPEGQEFYNVIDSVYRSMPEEIQNSKNGKSLRESLFHFKNSSVGQQAPGFEVTDVNNQPLALSSFRGKKYVLLDFWASWCIPCRQDYPFLKQVYENYQSKGLEIILISSDKDLMKWRAAIKQDGTDNWKHFSLQENNSLLETSYSIIGIPLKVLIDRDGKIIARWLGGAEEKINDEMRKTFVEIFE